MRRVFISLLNYNGKKNSIDCIHSLCKIKPSGVETKILLVDNNSSDGSQSKFLKIESENSCVKAILNNENLGFSGGHNVAIRYALKNEADYVLILNNDTYVKENFLSELIRVAENDKKIGIIVPKIYFAPGYEFHEDRYSKEEQGRVLWYAGGRMDWSNIVGYHRGVDEVDAGQFNKKEETELATGCCMLIKKEIFEKVGFLDEKYFLYYEDSDFSVRLRKKGFRIIYAPSSIIYHKNAGSVGGSGSLIQDYYITRNRLLFGLRYAPFRTRLALIRESVKLLISGRNWQKQGVIDYYLGNFGKGSYKNG